MGKLVPLSRRAHLENDHRIPADPICLKLSRGLDEAPVADLQVSKPQGGRGPTTTGPRRVCLPSMHVRWIKRNDLHAHGGLPRLGPASRWPGRQGKIRRWAPDQSFLLNIKDSRTACSAFIIRINTKPSEPDPRSNSSLLPIHPEYYPASHQNAVQKRRRCHRGFRSRWRRCHSRREHLSIVLALLVTTNQLHLGRRRSRRASPVEARDHGFSRQGHNRARVRHHQRG